MSIGQRFWRWLVHADLSETLVAQQAAQREWRRQAVRAACPICSESDVLVCPKCLTPITGHTHERDFICDTHGFVWPIRQSDGQQVNGDGLGFNRVTGEGPDVQVVS